MIFCLLIILLNTIVTICDIVFVKLLEGLNHKNEHQYVGITLFSLFMSLKRF